jgi:hypothetical protein
MEPVDDPKHLLRDQFSSWFANTIGGASASSFEAGRTRIPIRAVYDIAAMTLLTESALDFGPTAGPYSERFERRMRQFLILGFRC